MRFEHFALNVKDSRATAAWYVEHCGLRVARASNETPYVHFLADGEGRVMIELYSNPAAPVPDYSSQHPLSFHFALAVEGLSELRDRLVAGGATLVEDKTLADGSRIAMVRDPWGIPIQLCSRAVPLV
ncbi:MAG: VOC family protein [Deltaproteobacteria bacterium]|nr:VOC family protein [Deltaproteobacteria bacterium]